MRNKKSAASPSEIRRAARLGLCVVIFAAACVVNNTAGGLPPRLRSAITRDVDFIAAFSEAGRAIDGGEPFTEAVGRLYGDIFGARGGAELEVYSQFEQSQQAFSEYELPPNVSTDMHALGFDYSAPAEGGISDGFGYRVHPVSGLAAFHYGVDIAAAGGAEALAFADGTVEAVGENSVDGKYVRLAHKNGVTTFYAHLDSAYATEGETLKRGAALGLVGSTGNATGPCLHFEVRLGETYLNPAYYL